jgi:hypothetical protein
MKIDAKTEVPASVLAMALGVSRMRIGQLAADAVIPRIAKGRFPLLASVAGYVSWLKDEQRRVAKSAGNSRINDARAAEIEIRTAERLKTLQLLGPDEGLAVVDAVLGPMRSDLQSVPARMTKDLALRLRLESELNGVLDSAADRARTYRRREPAGDEPVGNRRARRAAAAGNSPS